SWRPGRCSATASSTVPWPWRCEPETDRAEQQQTRAPARTSMSSRGLLYESSRGEGPSEHLGPTGLAGVPDAVHPVGRCRLELGPALLVAQILVVAEAAQLEGLLGCAAGAQRSAGVPVRRRNGGAGGEAGGGVQVTFRGLVGREGHPPGELLALVDQLAPSDLEQPGEAAGDGPAGRVALDLPQTLGAASSRVVLRAAQAEHRARTPLLVDQGEGAGQGHRTLDV